MKENTTKAGADVPAIINGISADDTFTMASIVGKIGISEVIKGLDPDALKALDYKPPMMMGKDGKMVPLPEDKWTEGQQRQALNAIEKQSEFYSDLFEMIMTHFGDCRAEVYSLLASATGRSEQDIAGMSGTGFVKLLYDYISRDEFIDFFTVALRQSCAGLLRATTSITAGKKS